MLWWSGPQWLVTNKFPEQRQFCETKEELKGVDHKVKQIDPNQMVLTVTESKNAKMIFDLTKQNSFEKSLRIVATVKRALSRFKGEDKKFPSYITPDERTESLFILLRQEQGLFYKVEVSTLKTKSQVDKNSRILKLYPFLHETVSNVQCGAVSLKKTVLLSTAYVMIEDANGTPVTLRAMLDSGSQASFISESRANALKVKILGDSISITPFGSSSSQKTKGVLSTVLNDAVHVDLHVVSKISNLVPPQ